MSLISDFNDRKDEIKSYIQFLEQIEARLKAGRPLLSTSEHEPSYGISPMQQKILYSSLYLQLYNIIESTVTRCIVALEKNIQLIDSESWGLLTDNIRKELLRAIAKKHALSTIETRADAMLDLLNNMLLPRSKINASIDRGGGGNWDDEDIFALSKRIGLRLTIPEDLIVAIKKTQYNDKRGLELVKYIRNKLAHGELSFVECGESLSFEELKKLSDVVFSYLETLIVHFDNFITQKSFMNTCDTPVVSV